MTLRSTFFLYQLIFVHLKVNFIRHYISDFIYVSHNQVNTSSNIRFRSFIILLNKTVCFNELAEKKKILRHKFWINSSKSTTRSYFIYVKERPLFTIAIVRLHGGSHKKKLVNRKEAECFNHITRGGHIFYRLLFWVFHSMVLVYC